ncbi:alpha/beta fold hydrolase [Flammeovirga aprica]|uniref:Proline iminopeptidase n=1 Tax=Flammeovirga aprica JL-4 TaxID=694437 RepID=A0A7X9X9P3_9BACT|nr:alpha/beta fold hydrolase [Flammeovirga aprica]NME68966.1 alpha/beta fold hydrolase [Flammeovirga aprica JL-4]
MNPYDVGYYETEDGHSIYYEQIGHPLGMPVLYLHGGPGAGLDSYYHLLLPSLQNVRLIGIDQRGSGKSKPLGSLKNNSIEFLVKDLEQIRQHLHISSWYIFGGSWGSTLALAYSYFHPKQVRGLNLWGVFFCNQQEINWLYKDTAPIMYSDIFSKLFGTSPSHSPQSLFLDYQKKLQTPESVEEYATKWLLWEAFTSEHPDPVFEDFSQWQASPQAIACAKIENHYFLNAPLFINGQEMEFLLENIEFDFPIYITHGRNDLVTPAASALKLKSLFPHAYINIIKNSGHSLEHKELKESILHFGRELLG